MEIIFQSSEQVHNNSYRKIIGSLKLLSYRHKYFEIVKQICAGNKSLKNSK